MSDVNFVDPAVPAKKTFVTLKDYFKARVIELNSDASSLDFTDFDATVDGSAKKISLALKSNHKNRYVLANPVDFTYGEIDFNGLMTTVLEFAQTYSRHQRDDVMNALPDGLVSAWDDEHQKLKVTVASTANTFGFESDDATLVTALFQDAEFEISFVEDAINVGDKLANTTINVTLSEFVAG